MKKFSDYVVLITLLEIFEKEGINGVIRYNELFNSDKVSKGEVEKAVEMILMEIE